MLKEDIADEEEGPVLLLAQFRDEVHNGTERAEAKALHLALQRRFKPIWMGVLDHLRTFDINEFPRVVEVIDEWMTLGYALDFNAYPKLVGCSWHMCWFFEEVTRVNMLACKGCEQVQYCDRSCQRL